MHLGASIVLLNMVAPDAVRLAMGLRIPGELVAAVIFVALPALTYVLIASLWLVRLTHQSLGFR